MGGGDHDLSALLDAEFVHRVQNDIDAVFIDKVDQRQQIAAGRVVLGVFLELTPGVEEDQLGVGAALAGFEVASGSGEGTQGFAAADEGDTAALLQQVHDFEHRADVGPAQDRVRFLDAFEAGIDRRGTRQPDRGVDDVQPPVGLLGERGAEAEGLGQGQLGAVEGTHHVPGSAPAVDRLGRVADHHQLGVGALGIEDLFDEGLVSWASSSSRKSAWILGSVRAQIFR